MNCDNQQIIYCDDGECRVYCSICDKLCIERVYKNHLKSQTLINIIRKRKNSKIFNSTLTEQKQ